MNQKIFTAFIFLTIALAVFFRTYNYPNRVSVNSDNSRDVQVALFAADNLELPQIGQFSSAGPFFYGPWWYWFLEAISFFPLGVLTHWYFMTLLSLLFVLGVYYLGHYLGSKWLGVLAALFAAISPAQIENSFSAWNPSIIPLLVLISLIFLIRYYQYRKATDIALLGFTVGLALSIHFQSILILPTLLTATAIIKLPVKNYLKHLFILGISVLIPFLPLIQFDSRFNWHNFKNIYFYLTVGQYNIWVPNRWLTYAGKYWPETWGSIIGGHYAVSLIILGLLGLLFISKLKTYKRHLPFYLIAVTFLMEIVLYRYYRGERFIYYSYFAHPSVILLTAWVVYQLFRQKQTGLFKIKPLVGAALGLLIFFSTLNVSLDKLKDVPISFSKVTQLKQDIYQHYPSDSFDIYSCKHFGPDIAYPLALFMYRDNRNQLAGIKIEACMTHGQPSWRAYSEKELDRIATTGQSNQNVTTEKVFKDTVQWWTDKALLEKIYP